MQLSNSFDPVTLGKVKRSALISLAGFVIAVVPMLLPDILAAVQDKPYIAALVGAAGPWIVNTIREWMKGQTQ